MSFLKWLIPPENGIRYDIFNRNSAYISMSIIKNQIKQSIPTALAGSHIDHNISKKDTPSVIVNLSEEQSLVNTETSFRLRYANELRSKKTTNL